MSFLLGIYSNDILLPLVDQIILYVIRAKKIVIDWWCDLIFQGIYLTTNNRLRDRAKEVQ